MLRILDIPRFWGPLLTIVFTGIYHSVIVYFGLSLTIAPLVIFLVAGTFVGGLRAGLVCAIWITLYSYFSIDDLARIYQIMISAFAIAIVMGYLRRRERQLSDVSRAILANGNVHKIKEARQLAIELKQITEGEVNEIAERINDKLGNTLAIFEGYGFLRDEIERVEKWYSIPKNKKRLQQMLEEES